MSEPAKPDPTTSLCLLYAFDPRGTKMGGLETYSRDFIKHHPQNVRLLVVGVDSVGDLPLGRFSTVEACGRQFDFFPVAHFAENQVNRAAKRLSESLTVRFTLGLIRYLPRLRRLLRAGQFTVDNRRVELGPFCWALGVPFIQMMHDEGKKTTRDALVNKFVWMYNLVERISMTRCTQFLCVNPIMTAWMQEKYPRYRQKISTLTTWYDPALIKPTDFRAADQVFRIAYFGRLDSVKNPSQMFNALAEVERRIGRGRVEFHYVGAWDPNRWPEFDRIRGITKLHGYKTMPEIAALLMDVHAGILTSTMEGMPRCVLETLGAGRPVCAVHLPQLESVLRDGENGYLVPRKGSEGTVASALAGRLIEIWEAIRAGRLDPDRIASTVAEYTPDRLLGRVFEYHRALHPVPMGFGATPDQRATRGAEMPSRIS